MINRFAFPYGVRGILPDEITVAEALRARGYKTGIFGKWHLGDHSPYLPNDAGEQTLMRQGDGFHLNLAGANKLAKEILKQIG